MRKKLLKISALAAVGFGAWFSINVNAQTNILTQPQISWALTNSMDGSLKDTNGNYIIKPFRFQLSAKISGELVTNWTTTSIEYPTDRNQTINGATTLLYVTTGYHESGVIISNTVATVEWHGKQIPVVLESVKIGTTNRVTWK